jgi:maltose alpha-D-glucosyltransferase/alpha-amylase
MKRALALLEGEVLLAYLPTRRWYAAKQTGIRRVALGERQEWADWLLTMIRVELDDGAAQDYFLPLSVLWEGSGDDATVGAAAAAALARIRRQGAPGLLHDAFADLCFVRALAQAMTKHSETRFGTGRLVFSPTVASVALPGEETMVDVRIPTEGSNSAAILDDRLFLKAYRRLRPGLNPEVEMGRFLTEVSPFSQIVPLVGFLEFRSSDGELISLAVLQEYVPNQGDLRQTTLDLLDRLGDEYGDRSEEWDADPAQLGYATLVDTLGRRIAELHRALTRMGGGEAFDPEPLTDADLATLREDIEQEARATLQRLGRHLPDLPQAERVQAEALLGRRDDLTARIADLTPAGLEAVKTRCHGDLHLGQVLVTENDIVVIDFEGEPARPLAERRAKQCPLVDVAGVVRSFHYAGGNALERLARDHPSDRERIAGPIARWRLQMIRRFLAAYEETASGSPSFPRDSQQAQDLIRLFTLQKALYEIRYELDNRPTWVGIPIQGVADFLDSPE